MTTVSVVIPWREVHCPHRTANLEHISKFWPSDWEIILSEDPTPDKFIKGEAVRVGVEKARGDVVVMHDGDLLTFPRLPQAVEAVRHGAAWSMPMTQVSRLSPRATIEVREGANPFERAEASTWPGEWPKTWLDERPYKYDQEAGGCMVTTRRTLLEIPIDRRYTGYGAEDESHGMALTMLRGKGIRIEGPCFHLWHPPQTERHKVLSPENVAIRRRYQSAWGRKDRTAMGRLIAETLAL